MINEECRMQSDGVGVAAESDGLCSAMRDVGVSRRGIKLET